MPFDAAACVAAVLAGSAVAVQVRTPADRRGRAVAGPREAVPARAVVQPSRATDRSPTLLDLVAAAMDVGLAPVPALAAVVAGLREPERSRLARAVAMVDVGGDASTAWRLVADDAVLGPLAQAIERSERSGAPVADLLRSLADEVRREMRAQRLAEARRVGVRTSAPLGVCFLPAFFLIAIVPTVVALVRHAF